MIITNKMYCDKEKPHNKAKLTMRYNLSTIAVFTVVFMSLFCMDSFAQNESPVGIEFDKNSERIDILTDTKLPAYTKAQRGSIQFFLGRLDKPEKGFHYFFDGRRFRNNEGLAFIRKIPAIGCWVIVEDAPDGNIPNGHPKVQCEIIHHAVSFIPLNQSGQPEQRVYILLDDLSKIQWAEYNHWFATDSQEELEAKQDVIY